MRNIEKVSRSCLHRSLLNQHPQKSAGSNIVICYATSIMYKKDGIVKSYFPGTLTRMEQVTSLFFIFPVKWRTMTDNTIKKKSHQPKLAVILLVLVAGIALVGLFMYLRPKTGAGLQVQTGDIPVELFLDGRSLGVTPYYADQLDPGTYNLTLQPRDDLYLRLDRKITLTNNFLTVIEWHPDSLPQRAWGIFLEPQPAENGENSSLDISSSPDNVIFRLDNTETQVTPQVVATTPQLHTLNFSLPGYESLTREIQVTNKEKIKIFVQLAKANEEIIQTEDELAGSGWDDNSAEVKVALDPTQQLIGATLRVLSTKNFVDQQEVVALRTSPDNNSEIIAYAPVGSNLSYLGNESGAFYKIQTGQKTAWVEKQFVRFLNN